MKETNALILKKIATLDKLVVNHNRLKFVVDGILDCKDKSEYYRESLNCLLVASGGMGKSTACRQILSKMPSYNVKDVDCERTIIPVFYAEVPSPATIKGLATTLLRRLRDPNPSTGNTEAMTERLCHLLKACKTKLILLDEFHHLIDSSGKSARLNLKVCNWIKNLVNRVHVSFCLIGLPVFEPILRADSQIARRFPLVYSLPPLTAGADGSGSLKPFLETVDTYCRDKLNIYFSAPLNSELMVHQFFAATSGNPSFVMSLIKEAIYISLKSQNNLVQIDDFAAAWKTGIANTASQIRKNPFRMTINMLANELRGYV